MTTIDDSDIENITKLVETYDHTGGFKFSWRRICAFIQETQNGRSDVPCGDCGKLLPLDMQCDNPDCVRVFFRTKRM